MPLPVFTELLRCPETHQKLTAAPPGLLARLRSEQAAGKLFTSAGKLVPAPIEEGLLREDGAMLYPVWDGIPVMVVEEAIPLTNIA